MRTIRSTGLMFLLAWPGLAAPAGAQERAVFQYRQRGICSSLAFSPDSKLLAATYSGDTIRLFDLGKKAELRPLKGSSASAYLLAFSADGKTLTAVATDSRDGERVLSVKRWDVATGEERASVFLKAEPPLALGPGGKVLVTKQPPQENTFRLWDTATGKELAAVRLSAGFASGAVFLPGGRGLCNAIEVPDREIRTYGESATKE